MESRTAEILATRIANLEFEKAQLQAHAEQQNVRIEELTRQLDELTTPAEDVKEGI